MTIRELYEWAVTHNCEERELIVEDYECAIYSDNTVGIEQLEIDYSREYEIDCVRICVD